jgi:excisionase family DNA binding protein
LTIRQASERWQVSNSTVRRLIESGRLSAVRIGSQLRIPLPAAESYERSSFPG